MVSDVAEMRLGCAQFGNVYAIYMFYKYYKLHLRDVN